MGCHPSHWLHIFQTGWNLLPVALGWFSNLASNKIARRWVLLWFHPSNNDPFVSRNSTCLACWATPSAKRLRACPRIGLRWVTANCHGLILRASQWHRASWFQSRRLGNWKNMMHWIHCPYCPWRAPPNLRWLMVTFHESWPFVGAARFESIGDKPFNCGRYLRIRLVKIRWVMRSHWIASNMVSFHSNDSSARSVHSFWTYLSFRVLWRQVPVGRRWLKRCPVGNSMWLVFKGLGDVKSPVLTHFFTTLQHHVRGYFPFWKFFCLIARTLYIYILKNAIHHCCFVIPGAID